MADEQKKRWYPGMGSDSGRFDSNPVPTGNMPSDPLAEQRDREIAQAGVMRDEGFATSKSDAERMRIAQGYNAYVNAANKNYRIGKARQAKGQLSNEDGDFGSQPATPAQRTTTGGGQAIAAENPDQQQQPTAATQPATGPGMMNLVREIPGRDGQPAIGVYRGQHGDVYVQGTPGQPGYGAMQVHGRPQTQGQSRPGLGLNGMRDLGNGQVAVGQVDGFQNPGYGFKGSREDAARFFQPVGRPGGYNPYRVDVGPTLFNRLQEERRAAKATPQPAEQGPMGWQRLRDQMNNESRERIAEMTGGFGLTQAGLQDARAREQLAQQYGINMAQLGNDNLRTQAALGLSGLQQQQAQNQMAWDAEKLKAYQRMNDPRLSPSERMDARRTFTALNGGEQKPDYRTLKDEMGNERLVRVDGDTYTPLTQEGQGGANFADDLKSFEAGLPKNQKDALKKIKDPKLYQQALLNLYAADKGVSI